MGNVANKLDGMIFFSSTAKPGIQPRQIAAEFNAAIADIATNGITERELTRVKNGVRASLLDQLSSVLGKADRLNYYNYFAGTPDYIDQDLARYEQLTVADVQRVARQYVQAPHKIILTVVPDGKRDMAMTIGGAN